MTKFRMIKEVDGEFGAYGVEGLRSGQVFDIKDERLAEKASRNPDFEQVKHVAKKKKKK